MQNRVGIGTDYLLVGIACWVPRELDGAQARAPQSAYQSAAALRERSQLKRIHLGNLPAVNTY